MKKTLLESFNVPDLSLNTPP